MTILQRVLDIIDPPALPAPPKKAIGFQACPSKPDLSAVAFGAEAEGRSRVKEGKARYVLRRKTG